MIFPESPDRVEIEVAARAGKADTESRDDFIEKNERAVLVRKGEEGLQENSFRNQKSVIRGHWLNDDRRNIPPVLIEKRFDRAEIIESGGQSVLNHRLRNPFEADSPSAATPLPAFASRPSLWPW